jgi:hypothetical protein
VNNLVFLFARDWMQVGWETTIGSANLWTSPPHQRQWGWVFACIGLSDGCYIWTWDIVCLSITGKVYLYCKLQIVVTILQALHVEVLFGHSQVTNKRPYVLHLSFWSGKPENPIEHNTWVLYQANSLANLSFRASSIHGADKLRCCSILLKESSL